MPSYWPKFKNNHLPYFKSPEKTKEVYKPYSVGHVQSQKGDYWLIQALHIDCGNGIGGSEDHLIHCLKRNQLWH